MSEFNSRISEVLLWIPQSYKNFKSYLIDFTKNKNAF